MVLLESIAETKGCFPTNLLILNIALASINGFLATIAFSQVCFAYPFLCNLYSLCAFLAVLGSWWKWGYNWCACICPDFEYIELSYYIEAVLLCLVSEKEEEIVLRGLALRFGVVKRFPFLWFYLVGELNGALDYCLVGKNDMSRKGYLLYWKLRTEQRVSGLMGILGIGRRLDSPRFVWMVNNSAIKILRLDLKPLCFPTNTEQRWC